jgi:CRISPR-associated protein Cas5h
MIAAILGYERNGYYEKFSTEKCRIALQIKVPARRLVQTISYLMTDKPLTLEKLRGIGSSAQVRFELVMAEAEHPAEVNYRIFFNHEDKDLMDKLLEKLLSKKFYFPPALGAANCLATVDGAQLIKGEIFRPQDEVAISTVIPLKVLESISPEEGVPVYIEELMPADFEADRSPRRIESYIYEPSGRPLKVRIKSEAFKGVVDGQIIGTFM